MSQQAISPPPILHSPDPAVGGSVRRSHTISSDSRRTTSRTTDHSEADEWNEHDTVGENWVGVVGTIGEKPLHRQASLPSKYNRQIRPPGNRSGALTPSRAVGGLSSPMDPGYDEGDWELEIRRTQEDANTEYQQAQQQQELNAEEETQEPTPYGASSSTQAGVRRYHTVTYGQHAPRRLVPSLQRAGTTATKRSQTTATPLEAADGDDKYNGKYNQDDGQEFEEPGLFHGHDDGQQIYGNASAGNSWQGGNDTWRPGNPGEWRGGNQMEDLSRAMGGMDLQPQGQPTQNNYAQGGPRFKPNARQASPNLQQQQYMDGSQQQQGRNLKLYTDTNQSVNHGPVSAGAYVPPIGHGPGGQRPQERTIGGRASNPNLSQVFNNPYGGNQSFNNMPPPPPIPAQYLNQVAVQHSGRLNAGPAFTQQGNGGIGGIGSPPQPVGLQPGNPATYLSSPVDVPTMISQKGYNPSNFDIKPPFARYFVIKSYTEDDVHKSLKYEIWSSTDPGNKRLDKAFKECAGRGPIYLFFSVNASGHFCGMAEMLTPVDYTRSSTVWASDKWKGVFKVRWIFVRDIPNAVLRNIRLNNTQERKPVTNSRDTQELLPEAGHEMLRIFFTHPARTSLLQDFAFYELQSMQKQQQQVHQQAQQPGSGAQSPQPGVASSLPAQQHAYAMPNPHAMPYPNMVPPMIQNIGYAPAPGVVQGVLRGASPGLPMVPNHGYGGSMGGNGNGF